MYSHKRFALPAWHFRDNFPFHLLEQHTVGYFAVSSTTVNGLCLLLGLLPEVALEVEDSTRSLSCCFFSCPRLFLVFLWRVGWEEARRGYDIYVS